MKKLFLFLVLSLGIAAPNLFAKETITVRCFLSGDGRIEVYSPGGKYEKIELPKWVYKDEKEIQLAISKKIEELNKQGFTVVSFNELYVGAMPFGLFSTYILTKE